MQIYLKMIIIVIIMSMFGGCSSIYYYGMIKTQTSKKKELIINLIKNPQNYDSLIYNSEFYNKDYFGGVGESKAKILKLLMHYKDYYTPNIKIEEKITFLRLENGEETLMHHFSIYFNEENKYINTNYIYVQFILFDSKWYLIFIDDIDALFLYQS